MAYVPDPTDPTHPLDTDPAATAAAEFRALKGYVQAELGQGTGMNIFRKNLVINGDMSIDQRKEGATSALSQTAAYGVDKWVGYAPAASTATLQRVAVENVRVLAYNVTVATAPLVGSIAGVETAIEGFDAAFLNWGNADAAPISISFLITSPTAGIHALALRNAAKDRCYVTTFNVPIAGTTASITVNNIPGDITGTWNSTTGIGLNLFIDYGSGSNFETATTGAWQAGNFTRTAIAQKPAAIVGLTKLGNVQIEQGVIASPFEQLHYTTKLQLCQRYYWKTFSAGVVPATSLNSFHGAVVFPNGPATTTNQLNAFIKFPEDMRVNPPTVTLYNISHNNALAIDYTSGLDCTSTTVIADFLNEKGMVMTMKLPNTNPPNDTAIWAVHATANSDFWA